MFLGTRSCQAQQRAPARSRSWSAGLPLGATMCRSTRFSPATQSRREVPGTRRCSKRSTSRTWMCGACRTSSRRQTASATPVARMGHSWLPWTLSTRASASSAASQPVRLGRDRWSSMARGGCQAAATKAESAAPEMAAHEGVPACLAAKASLDAVPASSTVVAASLTAGPASSVAGSSAAWAAVGALLSATRTRSMPRCAPSSSPLLWWGPAFALHALAPRCSELAARALLRCSHSALLQVFAFLRHARCLPLSRIAQQQRLSALQFRQDAGTMPQARSPTALAAPVLRAALYCGA